MALSNQSLHRLGNPRRFMYWATMLCPWVAALSAGLMGYGLYLALFASPADYLQGQSVRIMYVHVPSAWLSMALYATMAVSSACYLVWKYPLADLIARNAAPVGACFTAITLITGCLWGKPTWGAWWVWDARLTSVLILFFIYLGYLSLTRNQAIDDKNRKAAAYLALLGAINLPIIKFSVQWWNTLHQPASVIRMDGPTIHHSMLTPLLMMFAAMLCLSAVLVIWRVQASLYQQKYRRLQWKQMKR